VLALGDDGSDPSVNEAEKPSTDGADHLSTVGRNGASLLGMDFGTLSPMLKRLESKGLVTRRRQAADERRVLVDLTPKGGSLRKRTEQMLGEFYCFLNMPLEELFDLKDRLRHFVNSAGPKEAKTTLVRSPARAP
jgi:DNA-binding MarR family transcriptional regulator